MTDNVPVQPVSPVGQLPSPTVPVGTTTPTSPAPSPVPPVIAPAPPTSSGKGWLVATLLCLVIALVVVLVVLFKKEAPPAKTETTAVGEKKTTTKPPLPPPPPPLPMPFTLLAIDHEGSLSSKDGIDLPWKNALPTSDNVAFASAAFDPVEKALLLSRPGTGQLIKVSLDTMQPVEITALASVKAKALLFHRPRTAPPGAFDEAPTAPAAGRLYFADLLTGHLKSTPYPALADTPAVVTDHSIKSPDTGADLLVADMAIVEMDIPTYGTEGTAMVLLEAGSNRFLSVVLPKSGETAFPLPFFRANGLSLVSVASDNTQTPATIWGMAVDGKIYKKSTWDAQWVVVPGQLRERPMQKIVSLQ